MRAPTFWLEPAFFAEMNVALRMIEGMNLVQRW
jgi:hypothetical protein